MRQLCDSLEKRETIEFEVAKIDSMNEQEIAKIDKWRTKHNAN